MAPPTWPAQYAAYLHSILVVLEIQRQVMQNVSSWFLNEYEWDNPHDVLNSTVMSAIALSAACKIVPITLWALFH